MTQQTTKSERPVSGTEEWAEVNVNICKGCKHGCWYCFACANAVRFKRVKDREEWMKMKPIADKVFKKYKKAKGRIMFPSSHDITPETNLVATIALASMLGAGNELLIVSKPHLVVIQSLCNLFDRYKDQIMFRFTIGSTDDENLKAWEPGAPSYEERFRALLHAYKKGFKTSVSCEPYLDVTVKDVIRDVLPFVTDTVWIGKMRDYKARLKLNGFDFEANAERLKRMEESQTDQSILVLYGMFKDNPKIRWKESVKQIVGIEVPTKAGLDI